MNYIYLLILTISITLFSCNNNSNTPPKIRTEEDLYKVNLNVKDDKSSLQFDTTVTLDYLISDKGWYKGVSNFDRFNGFNYPKLKQDQKESELLFHNDTVTLVVKTIPFDIERFKKNTIEDSSYYTSRKYYGADPGGDPKHFPTSEISQIQIMINGSPIELNQGIYSDLFNPSLDNCLAYITNKNEIILTMHNGEISNRYHVVLLFDETGLLKRRIVL